MAGKWSKLLQELRFMPEDPPRYVTYGEDEFKGATERMEKSLRQGEQNALRHDIIEKSKRAVAALPGIKAAAKKFRTETLPMLKSLHAGIAETAEEFRKAQAIAEHRAALARFEDWNQRFGDSVRRGETSSTQASTLEALSHQRAAALVEQGRKLGVK